MTNYSKYFDYYIFATMNIEMCSVPDYRTLLIGKDGKDAALK
jgi:hypothetical protein